MKRSRRRSSRRCDAAVVRPRARAARWRRSIARLALLAASTLFLNAVESEAPALAKPGIRVRSDKPAGGSPSATGSTGRPNTSPSPSGFGAARLPEAGQQILLADLDGDGRDDQVVVYGGEKGCHLGRFVRGEGSAEPTFTPFETLKGAKLHAPALGDTDGDGTADLLSADSEGLVVRKGLGGGAFARSSRRLVQALDLVLPLRGCEAVPPYLLDVDRDGSVELVLPILGGVRIAPLALPAGLGDETRNATAAGRDANGDGRGGDPGTANTGATSSDRPSGASSGVPASPPSASGSPTTHPLPIEGHASDVLTEPRIRGSDDGLTFISAVLTIVDSGTSRIGVLGPVLDSSVPRLDLTWWSLAPGAPLEPHRTSLALPDREMAVFTHPFDLEGDGRPEIAVLTAPRPLTKLLGEFGLRVYHASDRADTPVAPFFSATTNINYWQMPVVTSRRAGAGSDLLIAFYRGLMTAHLNVEIFRGDGAGSFEKRSHDVELESDKEASRDMLIWADVDADGLVDLVAADNGLRIHRGTTSREKPVSSDVTWRTRTTPDGGSVSVNFSDEAGLSIRLDVPGGRVFRDLDGDGLAEAIFVKNNFANAFPQIVVEKLEPVQKR